VHALIAKHGVRHAHTALLGKAGRVFLPVYRQLVKAIDGATSDPKVTAALEAFEPLFFSNMALVLDRYFAHSCAW